MSTLRQHECLRCAHRWWPRQVQQRFGVTLEKDQLKALVR
jgi:hypothetical protein